MCLGTENRGAMKTFARERVLERMGLLVRMRLRKVAKAKRMGQQMCAPASGCLHEGVSGQMDWGPCKGTCEWVFVQTVNHATGSTARSWTCNWPVANGCKHERMYRKTVALSKGCAPHWVHAWVAARADHYMGTWKCTQAWTLVGILIHTKISKMLSLKDNTGSAKMNEQFSRLLISTRCKGEQI